MLNEYRVLIRITDKLCKIIHISKVNCLVKEKVVLLSRNKTHIKIMTLYFGYRSILFHAYYCLPIEIVFDEHAYIYLFFFSFDFLLCFFDFFDFFDLLFFFDLRDFNVISWNGFFPR